MEGEEKEEEEKEVESVCRDARLSKWGDYTGQEELRSAERSGKEGGEE